MADFEKYVKLIEELEKARTKHERFYPWASVSYNGSTIQVELFWADNDIEIYNDYPLTGTEDITYHLLEEAEAALQKAVRRANADD